MRAYQVMTPRLTTVLVDTPVGEAAELMLTKRISGLPVVDATGKLVGIVSEGDFLRRGEIGTRRRRSTLLEFFAGPGKLASEFIREEGRTVKDVMTGRPGDHYRGGNSRTSCKSWSRRASSASRCCAAIR